jgi:hypothetical protein
MLAPFPSSHPIFSVHITSYIKFQVTSADEHYSKWRQIVMFLLTVYMALDHITNSMAPPNPNDLWLAVDIHISLWFMGMLSDGRECSTWTRRTWFFLENKALRYLYLSKAFRNTPCGDLSIATYASKLQCLADDPVAIGRPVDDRDLTLQFIDGLDDKYKLQAKILKNVVPTFSDACSRLQLAEVSVVAHQRQASAQAMAIRTGGRGAPSTSSSQPPGVSPNYKGKNLIPGF